MSPDAIPLVPTHAAGEPVARWHGRLVTREEFLAHVALVAERLPQVRFGLNLCDDRYLFLVAFAALLSRGATNLLPTARVAAVVTDVAADFDACTCIVEREDPELQLPQFVMPDLAAVSAPVGAVPEVAAHQLAAVVFTSGSTGKPCPNLKCWGDLVRGSRLAQQRFDIRRGTEIVATVPPQHMYGLETSILLPLIAGGVMDGGRPFFAADICQALQRALPSRVLITTPVHLRICVGADLDWPTPNFVVSATAPLAQELATQAEQALGAPVMEIFGSTETGSIASRRTVSGTPWQLYEGLRIEAVEPSARVSGGHLPAPVQLHDQVRVWDRHSFELLGRQTDLINIAGKRASLADLNQKLLEIDGVEDGVFVPQDSDNGKVVRLTALVVAPGLDKSELLQALARCIDPAFMPRPLHFVAQLPRAATGKLPRAALLPLLEQLGSEA